MADDEQRRPSLPKLDTDMAHDEPASERLILAVAQTLDISRDDILLFDSFLDLGGDEQSAEALQQACRRRGIDVKPTDAISCHTIAELQTRITPYPPSAIGLAPPSNALDTKSTVSSSEDSGDSRLSVSPGADDIFTPGHNRGDSVSSYGSAMSTEPSIDGRVMVAPPKNNSQNIESLLKSSPRVNNVCLVTPKAGPFDGQLVALVMMTAGSQAIQDPGEIALPPASEFGVHKTEIRSLRLTLQEWGTDARRPHVWIPLRSMPLAGPDKPDTRRMQTWVQNLNETLLNDIMKLQIPEPRRARNPSLVANKLSAAGEDAKSVWKDEETNEDAECFALSPMQQLYFQTALSRKGTTQSLSDAEFRYAQSIMLRVGGGAEPEEVSAAIEAMVSRHAMLRARFRPTGADGAWSQSIIPRASNSYRFTYHTHADEEDIQGYVEAAQAAINPVDGPVFAVEHIKNEHEQMICLVAHHLVVDPISWRIITHDLDELLREGCLLSEGSIPFPQWVDFQSYELSQRLFEPTLPFEILPADLDFWGLDKFGNCYGNTNKISFSLDAELSSLLRDNCNEVLRTDTADIFLACLLLSFQNTFPGRALPTLWKQEHGRDAVHADFNIMETVGWFTSLCPIGVTLDATTDIIQVIKLMKDTRRAIPRDGIPFFTSEFSGSENAAKGIPVEVTFSYFDALQQIQRKDGILEPAKIPGQEVASLRSQVGAEVGRIALFEVAITRDCEETHIEFVYNRLSNQVDRIESWAQNYEHLVLQSIRTLQSQEPELTLSDVPLLRTSYKALTRLTADRLNGASSLPNVRDIETIYPVTPSQQEILMAQTQDIENFHIHATYELTALEGETVEQARLCEVWEELVALKPALRSIFIDSVSRDGLFDQVVLKKISPQMLFLESKKPEEALSQLPVLNKTQLAEPRHRLSVCRTSTKTFVRIDVSQAICDLASIHNLVAELCRAYLGEEPSHNEALHRTYLYHTSSIDTAYSLEVWKASLLDTKPCIFPQLTPNAEDVPRQQSFDLDMKRSALVGFCMERDIEPATVLHLAWALVLRAFTGMDHVTFGCQFSGRDDDMLSGISDAIGSFATILPCSIELSANRTVTQMLKLVCDVLASSQKHQNLTMAEIQHALRVRDQALFNTCFYFEQPRVPKVAKDPENEDEEEHKEEHKEEHDAAPPVERPELVSCARQSDCEVSMTAMFLGDHVHASISSRHLSPSQVQSVMNSFEQAVVSIVQYPTRLIAETDLFTERDHAQLVLEDLESSQRTKKIASCVHDLILAHGQERPDATAIAAWDGDVTYSELSGLSTRLRDHLVNMGVGPGMIVPVVLDKNRWAPIMLLAVLQAGASFVALDCQDQMTVKLTIAHLNPRMVLTTETGWKDLSNLVLNLLVVNDNFFAVIQPQMSYQARNATPEHAACVFVTPKRSGAGESRSIFFTHAALSSTFVSQGPALKMDTTTRVLQLSAFNVDVSLVEMLGTMVHGGCVCIPSPRERTRDLPGVMARMGVTWSYMTSVLARRVKPSSVPALKTICFRTRKLDPDTYTPWMEGRNLLLAYGAPDICPLGISITEITREKDLSIIAPPLSGRFWVLNPTDPRKLMPVGAIGELAIDSPIVTPHRYLADQPLVAPTYPHSSSPTPGSGTKDSSSGAREKPRYLKTGHRVRYLDNGNIQFLSSTRDEVLVDGSSVDVSDVEAYMRRVLGHGIDVVVDTIQTRDQLKVLAAFLELGSSLFQGQDGFQNVSPRVKERTFIAQRMFEQSLDNPVDPTMQRLPDYCVPSLFIPMKSFPTSTSLKINRRKLQRTVVNLSYGELLEMSTVPNPVEIQRTIVTNKPLPLTRPEEVMRSIWARVLSASPYAITGTSTFFSAGGNRFLAAELIVACRKVGLRLSLNDIFRNASLTDICRALATSDKPAKRVKPAGHSRLKISAVGLDLKFIKDVIVPQMQVPTRDVLDVTDATPSQIANLELGMYKTRADITTIVMDFNGPISLSKLETACDALTRMHPILRTAFIAHETRVCQVSCGSFKPVFQKFPCPNWRLESVTEKLVAQDQTMAFNPAEPVTQFTYLDSGKQGTLLVRLSRAQIDETSVPLMVQDLIALYEETKDVAGTAASFYDFARALRKPDYYEEGLEHWKSELEGARMTQVIDHPRPYGPTAKAQVQSVSRTVQIGAMGSSGMTHDTMVKAAWAMVLATISGNNDVLFGEVIQAHHVPLPESTDIACMVGPLTNTIPVRVRFPAMHSTPSDLMKYIQRQRRANSPYEAFDLRELVRKCTEWPAFTQFSTVVHHQTKLSTAAAAVTLNMADTTFSFHTLEPEAQQLPDLLLCSQMEAPERMALELRFAEGRVSPDLVEECMVLLVAAIETITYPDSITQPILQSAEEIAQSEKRVPQPLPETNTLRMQLDQLLLSQQRADLEAAVAKAWADVLKAAGPDAPSEADRQQTPFYGLKPSGPFVLLQAHFLADRLTQSLRAVRIKGLEDITISADEVIENPTMFAQLELVARRLRESGALSLPLGPLSRHKSMAFRLDALRPKSTVSQDAPLASPSQAQPSSSSPAQDPPLTPTTWKDSIRRLRSRNSQSGARGELNIKTKRSKGSKGSKDGSSKLPMSPATPMAPGGARTLGPLKIVLPDGSDAADETRRGSAPNIVRRGSHAPPLNDGPRRGSAPNEGRRGGSDSDESNIHPLLRGPSRLANVSTELPADNPPPANRETPPTNRETSPSPISPDSPIDPEEVQMSIFLSTTNVDMGFFGESSPPPTATVCEAPGEDMPPPIPPARSRTPLPRANSPMFSLSPNKRSQTP